MVFLCGNSLNRIKQELYIMKKLRTWLTSIVVVLCSVSVSAYDFIVKDGNYKLCYNITSAKDRTVVFVDVNLVKLFKL